MLFARPDRIVSGWNGWRQCDTQTIALNLASSECSLLYPEVSWAGPEGLVQTEFQLYPFLVSLLMRVFGAAEWPGQLVSILAVAGAVWILLPRVARHFGVGPAILSAALLLGARGPVLYSTTVMPDATCLLFYSAGLACFLGFLAGRRNSLLWIAALCQALAAMIKPTALSLGLFEFAACLFTARWALRNPLVWLSWLGTLLPVAVYFAHSIRIYEESGFSFGIGLGSGDSKFPTREFLLMPGSYKVLALLCTEWGLGYWASFCGLALLILRRLDRIALALICANVVMLTIAMRHTRYEIGTHYYLPVWPLGLWLGAAGLQTLRARIPAARSRWLAWVLGGLAGAQWIGHLLLADQQNFEQIDQQRVIAVGEALRRQSAADDLLIYRSQAPAWDSTWDCANNFEDPRPFYLCGRRGWVLPADLRGVTQIREYRRRGASLYAEHVGRPHDPELASWLARNARQIWTGSLGGRIYRIAR